MFQSLGFADRHRRQVRDLQQGGRGPLPGFGFGPERALVRKPRIILFDEATSALDNRTQAIVSQSLERLNATRIVIAHRLSTIQNADRIYAMDRGRIVQEGTYLELADQPGLFRQLVNRQLA